MKKLIRIALLAVLLLLVGVGLYGGWTLLYKGGERTILLEPETPYTSVQQILQNDAFKGKVVYADMWGTTCGPCLEEFQNHTKPLKQHYQQNKDVAFLYICLDKHPGATYRWKKRIKDYNVEGYHVLLNEEQFLKFYGEVANTPGSNQYAIPRYFIANKQGAVVQREAKRPSDYDKLYVQLDSILHPYQGLATSR